VATEKVHQKPITHSSLCGPHMHTSKTKVALAFVAAALLSGPAMADFTGATAPGNFSVSNTGALTGGAVALGSAAFSATQLLLTSSSSAGGCTDGVYSSLASPCQVQATINLPGTYSFNWAYVTTDVDGPAGDILGVMVNGTRLALSDLGGAQSQSGTASFVASASFGWMLNCTDCTGGAAAATISNFNFAPVPEPAPAALLLGGLLALATARLLRNRRRL
jgi:hypothetical protein